MTCDNGGPESGRRCSGFVSAAEAAGDPAICSLRSGRVRPDPSTARWRGDRRPEASSGGTSEELAAVGDIGPAGPEEPARREADAWA